MLKYSERCAYTETGAGQDVAGRVGGRFWLVHTLISHFRAPAMPAMQRYKSWAETSLGPKGEQRHAERL